MSARHLVYALTLVPILGLSPTQAQCPSPERTVTVGLGTADVRLAKSSLAATPDFLSFTVIAPPRHGILEDSGASLRYRPALDFWTAGVDSFQIEVVPHVPEVHNVPVRHLVQLIADGSRQLVLSWDAETPEPPDGWSLGTNLERVADSSWDGAYLLRPTLPPTASPDGELRGRPEDEVGGAGQGTGGSSGWRPPGGGGGSGLIGPDCEGPVLLAQGDPDTGPSLLVHTQTDANNGYLCLSAPGLGSSTSWHGVSPAPHHVELLHWKDPQNARSHSAGLWVDGELLAQLELSEAPGLEPSVHHAFAPYDPASGTLAGDLDQLAVFRIGGDPRTHCRGANTFETGADSSAWLANVPNNVTMSAWAALEGDWGAAIQIGTPASSGALFGLSLPAVPRRLGARFGFDPNGLAMASGSRAVLLTTPTTSGGRAFRVFLDPAAGGGYLLRIEARRDDGTAALSPPIPVTDAPHSVEVDWQRSPTEPAGTGFYRLWLDGQPVARLEGLTNDGQEVLEVKIGAVLGVGSGSGVVRVDSLEVWEQK